MTRLAVFIATFAHVGDFPVAPGTAGSAAGLVVFYLLGRGAPAQAAAIVVLFALGTWSGTLAERHFGVTDPGPVVIDEVMGMLITLFGIPVGWPGVLLGFVIFRAMDVVKPFPAGWLERLPGGLGVMADDGMAAVYGNLLLRLAVWAIPVLRLARLS
ncbi:MAG TPA: phosphatidylglycerophosphatase A [Vicinamibacterales bacterium]|nr:phosphatidylglycerophosphatase A [Vicinamibacterales bacterium]